MFVDGRSVPSDEVLHADVCVIGAGPAGIVAARELAGRGMKVCVLERGPLELADRSHALLPGVNAGLPYDLAGSRGQGFAGSSNLWCVRTPAGNSHVRLRRLDAEDFQARDWVPFSGWPLRRAELDRHYRRAEQLFSVPGAAAAADAVAAEDDGALAGPGTLVTRLFSFAPSAVFTADARVALRPADDVVVVTSAAAAELRCDDSPGEVSSLVARTASGTSFTVAARTYVLAAGGIENARLLLASRSQQVTGIGNAHGLVGRFFMEHPHYVSGLLWPSSRALFDDRAAYAIHGEDGLLVQRKYALDPEVVHREELLNVAFHFVPHAWSPRLRAMRYGDEEVTALRALAALRRRSGSPAGAQDVKPIVRRLPQLAGYAASAAAARAGRRLGLARYRTPQLFKIEAMAEQAPNPDSRVVLDDARDDLGLPLARLQWRLTDQDRRSVRRAQELVGQALEAAGCGKVQSVVHQRLLPPGLTGGYHHMGTTRMHPDPKQGVVDAHGRVHGTGNLYVAGSSVFPTGGYANPTLTVVALALRLAEHLARQPARTGRVDSGHGRAHADARGGSGGGGG